MSIHGNMDKQGLMFIELIMLNRIFNQYLQGTGRDHDHSFVFNREFSLQFQSITVPNAKQVKIILDKFQFFMQRYQLVIFIQQKIFIYLRKFIIERLGLGRMIDEEMI